MLLPACRKCYLPRLFVWRQLPCRPAVTAAVPVLLLQSIRLRARLQLACLPWWLSQWFPWAPAAKWWKCLLTRMPRSPPHWGPSRQGSKEVRCIYKLPESVCNLHFNLNDCSIFVSKDECDRGESCLFKVVSSSHVIISWHLRLSHWCLHPNQKKKISHEWK